MTASMIKAVIHSLVSIIAIQLSIVWLSPPRRVHNPPIQVVRGIGLIALCPRPHTGLFRQVLIPVRRHLPQVSDLQHHPQTYLSQLVLVIIYELHQLVFCLFAHGVLLQHTRTNYLSDTEHSVPHTVYREIQVMTSAL